MKNLLYIGNKLSRHGNTPTGIEILGPLLEKEGFKVTYASSEKNKILRLLGMLWQTLKSSTQKTSYVLIDTYSTSNFWYAFLVSQLCRILQLNYIPILHGGNLPQRIHKNPMISRMIFNNANCNIAPSGYLYDSFTKAGITKIIHIPNPVDLRLFPFKARDVITPKLLWVRSLTPMANPMMMLRVANLLKTNYQDLKIGMVGPDKAKMQSSLNEEAKRMDLHIEFYGMLSKDEWSKLSTKYDIFVNTSKVDNAPFSLIEAASLGLPIISTDVGGIPYLFTDKKNALLVPNDDAEAMAKAIELAIIDRRQTCEIIDNAGELANSFTWENIREKWLLILN